MHNVLNFFRMRLSGHLVYEHLSYEQAELMCEKNLTIYFT